MTIHLFQEPARISLYPIDSMENRCVGFVLEGIHLSDWPTRTKPVGFVWMGCPPPSKIPRRPEAVGL